jgi:hypothetical protein
MTKTETITGLACDWHNYPNMSADVVKNTTVRI